MRLAHFPRISCLGNFGLLRGYAATGKLQLGVFPTLRGYGAILGVGCVAAKGLRGEAAFMRLAQIRARDFVDYGELLRDKFPDFEKRSVRKTLVKLYWLSWFDLNR